MSEACKHGITAHRLVENLMTLEAGENFSRSTVLPGNIEVKDLQAEMSAVRQRMASAVSSTIAMLQAPGKKKFSRETVMGMSSTGNYVVTLIITRTA